MVFNIVNSKMKKDWKIGLWLFGMNETPECENIYGMFFFLRRKRYRKGEKYVCDKFHLQTN